MNAEFKAQPQPGRALFRRRAPERRRLPGDGAGLVQGDHARPPAAQRQRRPRFGFSLLLTFPPRSRSALTALSAIPRAGLHFCNNAPMPPRSSDPRQLSDLLEVSQTLGATLNLRQALQRVLAILEESRGTLSSVDRAARRDGLRPRGRGRERRFGRRCATPATGWARASSAAWPRAAGRWWCRR